MSVAEIAGQETERDRMTVELGDGWETDYAPGSTGCHEFLDRLSMIAEMVDRYLVSHPACVARPEWLATAEAAAASLHDLYQLVGAEHLATDDSDARS